jgi:hypothetical protein
LGIVLDILWLSKLPAGWVLNHSPVQIVSEYLPWEWEWSQQYAFELPQVGKVLCGLFFQGMQTGGL